jgi:class 3 adenylate cyclase
MIQQEIETHQLLKNLYEILKNIHVLDSELEAEILPVYRLILLNWYNTNINKSNPNTNLINIIKKLEALLNDQHIKGVSINELLQLFAHIDFHSFGHIESSFHNQRKYILVIDISSSTQMMDYLDKNNEIEYYKNLLVGIFYDISHFQTKLEKYFPYQPMNIYKFTGDGFILAFDEIIPVEYILLCCIRLVEVMRYSFLHFKAYSYANINDPYILDRIGLTFGLSYGPIYSLNETFQGSMFENEFFGKPINIACRLQAALKHKHHSNICLMDSYCFSRITNNVFKTACIQTEKHLKGIDSIENYECYYFNSPILCSLNIFRTVKDIVDKDNYENIDSNKILTKDEIIKSINNSNKKIISIRETTPHTIK